MQKFGQIVTGADLKRNRSDGHDRKLVTRTPGLGNNDVEPGGDYAEKHLKYPVGILMTDARHTRTKAEPYLVCVSVVVVVVGL